MRRGISFDGVQKCNIVPSRMRTVLVTPAHRQLCRVYPAAYKRIATHARGAPETLLGLWRAYAAAADLTAAFAVSAA